MIAYGVLVQVIAKVLRCLCGPGHDERSTLLLLQWGSAFSWLSGSRHMPSYLITGISGSGKTTIGRHLRQRGYKVIETDADRDLSGYEDRRSGKRVAREAIDVLKGDWFATHDWNWDKQRLRELFDENRQTTVFYCGGSDNGPEFYDWFALCFLLYVDDETLRRRLQKRERKRFADGSAEFTRLLAWNKRTRAHGERWKMRLINASRPPEAVTDEIIAEINKMAVKAR
jgi:shikimate kinase